MAQLAPATDQAAGGARRRLACPDCDLLLAVPAAVESDDADPGLSCPRCHAALGRLADATDTAAPNSLHAPLAFALAAALLLVLANAWPVLELDLHGRHTATTLWGTVQAMHADGMSSVAALVFVTIIGVPVLEVTAVLYLLLPLAWDRVPRGVAAVSRVVAVIRPWGMVEVFLLGALVAAVKLAQMAQLHMGLALWSCVALMTCVAGVAATFDDQQLWRRVDALRARHGART